MRFIDDNVTSIDIDGEGTVWFGTTEGISSFDGNRWTSYTEEDGLIKNRVRALAFDENGVLDPKSSSRNMSLFCA